MTMSWMVQAAMISIAAGLGLGFAIRFSLVSRVQDRSRRVAPQLGDVAPVMTDAGMRRTPTA
jgi:hypothetical protein